MRIVIVNETYDRLTKMSDPETRADYIGIPCGIGELDKMITGLNKSDLIILGARPGMGKTSFALNIVRNVATICDGKGGGRPDSAVAGAKDATKVAEAIAQVTDIVAGMLK